MFRDPDEAGGGRDARVARARAEARHAAGLRGHPHVVTVHDVLEHEGLPWIVMYPRHRTDPGSDPPWAVSSAAAPVGFGPLVAGEHRVVAGAGQEPGVAGAGEHRRPPSRVLRAALACGLGLGLALGGVWYALADRADEGTAAPYGDGVGLAEPLEDGDCVLADWPGERFTGTPRLSLDPTCRDKAPDGQVLAFVEAGSAEEARAYGPVRCEERTREVRGKLADVRSYAVVPTGDGFAAAGRRTACLVLGAHGPVYGPLAGHRGFGSVFADTTTMQRRDCLDVRSGREVRLVPCGGRHEEVVLGFTRLGAGVTRAEARAAADRACARDVPPRDYGFDPSVYKSGALTGEGPWKSGTHAVVCTVGRQNGGTMEGNEP
nr:septum formation family protein [Streptomyces sp. TRM68367]